jgi:putative membrane protein
MKRDKYTVPLSAIYFAVLIWSGINPKDYYIWVLEVIPGVVGFIVLALTYRRFRFTNLLYTLMLIHCCILFAGGHYTYEEVPLFDWIRDLTNGTRNNYDKLGHFAQGFVPAMIARELFLRLKVVNGKVWTGFFCVCVALAISACYEFVEWWTAVLSGASAEAFLGTQGYVWDTQSDMLYAFIGSLAAVILFSKYHDARLKEIEAR